MILDDCYKIPKIVIVKSGDKLDITDCVDNKLIKVYSLNKYEIDAKCTEFSIIKENEKSMLVLPTDNDIEKYLVKYEKFITKEEYEKTEQNFAFALAKLRK